MTQMDEIYEKHHMWAKPRLSMKPSEFVRRQCHVTFQNDPVAVATRAFTGVDSTPFMPKASAVTWNRSRPMRASFWR